MYVFLWNKYCVVRIKSFDGKVDIRDIEYDINLLCGGISILFLILFNYSLFIFKIK